MKCSEVDLLDFFLWSVIRRHFLIKLSENISNYDVSFATSPAPILLLATAGVPGEVGVGTGVIV